MDQPQEKLSRLLEGLQRCGQAVDVFFRDDDVDEDEPSLRRLLDIFRIRRVPICLGVIPGRLTAAAAELLRERQASVPGELELVQHGWQHVNHETSGRKCEFGTSRAYDVQLSDLAAGQERMVQAFGNRWFPAFIPPWNRCTPETYRALDRLDFRVLSQDWRKRAEQTFRFRQVPVTMDLFSWKEGPRLRPADEILAELGEQLTQAGPVGVMLHHKVMSDEAFTFLATTLNTLRQSSVVRFRTLQSLYEEAVEPER